MKKHIQGTLQAARDELAKGYPGCRIAAQEGAATAVREAGRRGFHELREEAFRFMLEARPT
jgi:hypothetical protein